MPEQQKKEREREQRGHALPESDRGAFIERKWPARRNRGACRPRLHLAGKLGDIAKTLGGIDRDRARERGLEPRRQVRAERRECFWSVSAWRSGGVNIAIRVLAGEGAEHGDAHGIDVGGLVPGFA